MTITISHVFVYLAILAFFLDQIVEPFCGIAQQAHEQHPTKKYFWQRNAEYLCEIPYCKLRKLLPLII